MLIFKCPKCRNDLTVNSALIILSKDGNERGTETLVEDGSLEHVSMNPSEYKHPRKIEIQFECRACKDQSHLIVTETSDETSCLFQGPKQYRKDALEEDDQ